MKAYIFLSQSICNKLLIKQLQIRTTCIRNNALHDLTLIKIIVSHFVSTGSFYSNTYLTKCNFTQFILPGNCSTYFGWYLHPSSGAQTTVSTASSISHTVTVICRYRGRVVTGSNSSTIAADNSNGVTNIRCCRYSC